MSSFLEKFKNIFTANTSAHSNQTSDIIIK